MRYFKTFLLSTCLLAVCGCVEHSGNPIGVKKYIKQITSVSQVHEVVTETETGKILKDSKYDRTDYTQTFTWDGKVLIKNEYKGLSGDWTYEYKYENGVLSYIDVTTGDKKERKNVVYTNGRLDYIQKGNEIEKFEYYGDGSVKTLSVYNTDGSSVMDGYDYVKLISEYEYTGYNLTKRISSAINSKGEKKTLQTYQYGYDSFVNPLAGIYDETFWDGPFNMLSANNCVRYIATIEDTMSSNTCNITYSGGYPELLRSKSGYSIKADGNTTTYDIDTAVGYQY